MSLSIAPLTAADAPAYRALMLEAYAQAADAFTSTAEERAGEPLAWWVARIGTADGLQQCFGAFEAGQLVGSVALEFAHKPKTRHTALLIGMYVRPGARRLGAGRALLQAAVAAAAARPGLRLLSLTVTEGNEAALGLYRAAGFVAWGVQPLAIRTPSGYKGKVHMAMQWPDGAEAATGAA